MIKKTTVMAEVGSTHGRSPMRMRELIDGIARAKAQVAKFQWVSSAKRLAERRNAPEYERAYSLINFDPSRHKELRQACMAQGLLYGCTVYLPEDIPTIVEVADILKISSFEAGDLAFVTQVLFAARTAEKPVVISLGGRSREEAVKIYAEIRKRFYQSTSFWNQISFLHCISAYPCELKDLQLRCLREVSYSLGRGVEAYVYKGFSDHTTSVLSGAFAVLTGATILEKHIRHAETSPYNADYAVSLSPAQFIKYVENVRYAELAYGDQVLAREVTESEQAFTKYQCPPQLPE